MVEGLTDFSDTCHWRCVVLRVRVRAGLDKFPVATARGKHLFPFRTEQLSPSAPMVLGPQGPGRVGRRRFLQIRVGRYRGPPFFFGVNRGEAYLIEVRMLRCAVARFSVAVKGTAAP